MKCPKCGGSMIPCKERGIFYFLCTFCDYTYVKEKKTFLI